MIVDSAPAQAPLKSEAPAPRASRFVLLCTREPQAAGEVALAAARAGVESWDEVLRVAGAHRVTAYVQAALGRAGDAAPPEAVTLFRQAVRAGVANKMVLDLVLRRALAALAAESIPTIVLKGPVLERTLYPASRYRPYGDVDLSVPEGQGEAAAEVLLAGGLVEISYQAETARQAHGGHFHGEGAFHRQFVDPRTNALVELHTDPLQLGLEPRDEPGRWRRAVPVPGLPGALMLSPEDQLVQLSLHAHKHGFERLIWLKDLDLLIRAHGGSLDWELVRQTARAEGVSASVWYALDLTRELLGTPVPAAPLRRLRPALPLRALYRLTWPPAQIAGLQGFMRRRAVQFHAAESWRGMVPSLIYMGQRGARTRALVQALRPH